MFTELPTYRNGVPADIGDVVIPVGWWSWLKHFVVRPIHTVVDFIDNLAERVGQSQFPQSPEEKPGTQSAKLHGENSRSWDGRMVAEGSLIGSIHSAPNR